MARLKQAQLFVLPSRCCCLQYNAPGFLKNGRQFRQFGFAAIELAQVCVRMAQLWFAWALRHMHVPHGPILMLCAYHVLLLLAFASDTAQAVGLFQWPLHAKQGVHQPYPAQ